MKIDFATVSILPGVQHRAFKEDHQYPNAVYQTEYVYNAETHGGDYLFVFTWDIMSGELRSLIYRAGDHEVDFENLKTFAELKTLLSFIPLPYPENWP